MMRMTMQKMLAKLRVQRDLRSQRGFTFTELLVSLLIMVLLATFVAQSIPVAFSTYRQVVADSNAQVALSTTTSALRDELGLAIDVKPGPNGSVFYQTPEGTWATIENGDAVAGEDEGEQEERYGLVKRVYADKGTGFDPTNPGKPIETVNLVPNPAIIGAKGGYTNLRVQMKESSGGSYITYSNGVFTVNRVEVLVEGQAVESVDNFKVKVILDPA